MAEDPCFICRLRCLRCRLRGRTNDQNTATARRIPSSPARNRDIWLAASYAVCMTGDVFIPVLSLPICFPTVHGDSAIRAGVMLTPLMPTTCCDLSLQVAEPRQPVTITLP